MIIWIASYPKSGNTWIRSFISAILNTQDGNFSFKNLESIPQYPIRQQFEGFLQDFSDINNIKKNWITTQTKLNLDNEVKFLKTHHVNCKIENDAFTNFDNTLGVIYIVRDPRNVITSLKNHYLFETYDETLKFMFDENKYLGSKYGTKSDLVPTVIGSWRTNYNSWKIMKKNFLIIKYESLISEPEKEFKKVSDHVSKLLDIKFEYKKIKDAIDASSFDKMQEMEKNYGFVESPIDNKTGNKLKFFNLGPKNIWEKYLSDEIRFKIEDSFKLEMKELDYL